MRKDVTIIGRQFGLFPDGGDQGVALLPGLGATAREITDLVQRACTQVSDLVGKEEA